MVTICDIKFDQNAYGIYFSGQAMSGKVYINLDKPKTIKGISLQICGFSKTSWREMSHTNKTRQHKSKVEHYHGREDYLSTTTFLVGSENGNNMNLVPGTYTYSFSCALPTTLPSSFEGKHGHIRYLVRIVFVQPWKFDQRYTVGFTVVKPFDLNYEAHNLNFPSQTETIKNFSCVCSCSKPISIIMNLPQIGFVPGQVIPIQVDINNTSSVRIKSVAFFLQQIITYHSQIPEAITKIEVVNISKRSTLGVPKHTFRSINEMIPVPSIPPTSLNYCRLMQICYDIKVEAEIAGIHANPFAICTITIGTIPLPTRTTSPFLHQPEPPQTDPATNTNDLNMLPIRSVLSPQKVPASSSDLPPPTYQEAVCMQPAQLDTEDEHPLQKSKYLPRYPVYDFGQENPATPSAPLPDSSSSKNLQ